MKKLNKLVLNKAKIMSAPQMKNITGGYDGGTYKLCFYNGSNTWASCSTDADCTALYGSGATCETKSY